MKMAVRLREVFWAVFTDDDFGMFHAPNAFRPWHKQDKSKRKILYVKLYRPPGRIPYEFHRRIEMANNRSFGVTFQRRGACRICGLDSAGSWACFGCVLCACCFADLRKHMHNTSKRHEQKHGRPRGWGDELFLLFVAKKLGEQARRAIREGKQCS